MGEARAKRERPGHEPIEPEHRLLMNAVGDVLADAFKGYGFCLLVFPFGEHDGRMNYISNSERGDMIVALKEFIANNEYRVHTTTTKQ